MATRAAARYVSRLFSSGGKVLSEEEKAAENVYIKKMEKLEKLAHKVEDNDLQDPKPAEETPATHEPVAAEVKPGTTSGSSAAGASTDKYRNYAVLAGTVAAVSALGWYLLSKPTKSKEV